VKKLVPILAILAIPCAFFLYQFATILFYAPLSDMYLRMPWVYKPIASRLAILCQSYPLGLPEHISKNWFPQGAGSVFVKPDGGFIIYGGGFYHYGYVLQLDKVASNPQTHIWNLNVRREGSDADVQVWSFPLPITQVLSLDELKKLRESSSENSH
jgi:hypothetical protein